MEAVSELYCVTPRELTRYLTKKDPTRNDIRNTNGKIAHIQAFDSRADLLTQTPFFWGSRTNLIGLTDAGARFAQDRIGIKTARPFDTRDLEHEFFLSCFHIRLKAFAESQGFGFEWQRNRVDYKKFINPDAVAVLITPEGRFTYCIEIERQAYNQNHLEKGKKYHAVYGHKECKDLFGAERVRVIFVTLSERRRQTMLEKFAEEYPYRMFWFTTTDLFMEQIGATIFQTPKDFPKAVYSFVTP